LAELAAILLASSLVSNFAADRGPGLFFETNVAQLLTRWRSL